MPRIEENRRFEEPSDQAQYRRQKFECFLYGIESDRRSMIFETLVCLARRRRFGPRVLTLHDAVAVFLGFFVVVTPARAGWEVVGRGADGQTAMYIDRTTIKAAGNVRQAWVLQDLAVPDQGFRSVVMFGEFDCIAERFRYLAATGYSGPMGTGTPIKSEGGATDWKRPIPRTLNDDLLKSLCSK